MHVSGPPSWLQGRPATLAAAAAAAAAGASFGAACAAAASPSRPAGPPSRAGKCTGDPTNRCRQAAARSRGLPRLLLRRLPPSLARLLRQHGWSSLLCTLLCPLRRRWQRCRWRRPSASHCHGWQCQRWRGPGADHAGARVRCVGEVCSRHCVGGGHRHVLKHGRGQRQQLRVAAGARLGGAPTPAISAGVCVSVCVSASVGGRSWGCSRAEQCRAGQGTQTEASSSCSKQPGTRANSTLGCCCHQQQHACCWAWRGSQAAGSRGGRGGRG